LWAVLDSGIDADHPHIQIYSTLGAEVGGLHRDFAVDPASGAQGDPLTDAYGHGSHVAGIIAGGLPSGGDGRVELRVAENVSLPAVLGTDTELFDLARLRDRDAELVKTRELEQLGQREVADPIRLDGIARRCRLVSLRCSTSRVRVGQAT
jgi:subtilisin family serine protease